MNVFSYNEPVAGIGEDAELLALWRRSWSKHGFLPRILGRADIAYRDLDLLRAMEASKELRRGPTPDGYSLACSVRWVAYLSQAPAMFADYDCLNQGLTPDDVLAQAQGDLPLFLSANNCPCAVYATPTGVREMVGTILQHSREVDGGEYDPTTHPSELSFIAHDQAIFGRYSFRWHYPRSPLVCNYSPDNEEWKNYKLIHYPNDTTPKPRGETIKTLNLFA